MAEPVKKTDEKPPEPVLDRNGFPPNEEILKDPALASPPVPPPPAAGGEKSPASETQPPPPPVAKLKLKVGDKEEEFDPTDLSNLISESRSQKAEREKLEADATAWREHQEKEKAKPPAEAPKVEEPKFEPNLEGLDPTDPRDAHIIDMRKWRADQERKQWEGEVASERTRITSEMNQIWAEDPKADYNAVIAECRRLGTPSLTAAWNNLQASGFKGRLASIKAEALAEAEKIVGERLKASIEKAKTAATEPGSTAEFDTKPALKKFETLDEAIDAAAKDLEAQGVA